MKLVCQISAPCGSGLNYAILDLDIETVDRLLRLIAHTRQEKAKAKVDNEHLYNMEYFDCSLEYYSSLDLDDMEDDWNELPADTELEAEEGRPRISAATVHVADEYVYWQAYEKHTGERAETPTLDREQLEEFRDHMLAPSDRRDDRKEES